MATDMYRTQVSFPKNVEDAIYDIRKREEYKRMPISEIIRMLVVRGLDEFNKESAAQPQAHSNE